MDGRLLYKHSLAVQKPKNVCMYVLYLYYTNIIILSLLIFIEHNITITYC